MKKRTLGQMGKTNPNEAKTKPIQTQFKPNSNPIQSQYKANTKPIQSQYKPNTNPIQTQYKANTNPISTGRLTPQEIAFSIVCELVKIGRPGAASGSDYMTIAFSNNWKAEGL
jgi:hypothetical protein